MMNYILDDDNNAIKCDFEEHIRWTTEVGNKPDPKRPELPFRRKVAQAELDGEWEVSTVFLGLDHNWGAGEPLLFETMIFSVDQNIHNWCDRYSTWKEAQEGHDLVVSKLLAGDREWFHDHD